MANEQVWNFFYQIYGGGPGIVRKHKDIYTEDTFTFEVKFELSHREKQLNLKGPRPQKEPTSEIKQ